MFTFWTLWLTFHPKNLLCQHQYWSCSVSQQSKPEIYAKAQREAAGFRKSDWRKTGEIGTPLIFVKESRDPSVRSQRHFSILIST